MGDRREPPRRENPLWTERAGMNEDGNMRSPEDIGANGANISASDMQTLRSSPRYQSPGENWRDYLQYQDQSQPPPHQPQPGYQQRGAQGDQWANYPPQWNQPDGQGAMRNGMRRPQPSPQEPASGQGPASYSGRSVSPMSDLEALVSSPRQHYVPQLPSSPLHPAYPVAPELDSAPLEYPVTRKVPAPRFPARANGHTPVPSRRLTAPPAPPPYWDDDDSDDVAQLTTVHIPIITSALKSVRKLEKNAHLLRGTIVQVAGRVLKIGAGVIAFSLASRGLGVDYFGDYVVVFAFVMLFNAVATFGVDRILVRDLAQAEEHTGAHDHFVRVSVSTKLLMSFLAMGLAILFAFLVQFPTRIILEVALFTPYILVTAFCSNGLFGSVLQANFQSGRIAVASTLAAFVTLGATAAAWVIHGGVNLFLFAYVLAGIVDLAICYTGARKYAPLRPAWSMEAAKYVMKESWPLGVASGFVMVYGRIDTVMLEKLTNNQQVSLYGVAYKFFDVLATVAATVMIVVFPALARAFAQGRKVLGELYSRVFSLMLAMSLALTFLVVQFRQLAIVIVVGHKFLAAQTAIPGLMLAIAIVFPSSVVSYMMIVTRHQSWQISLAIFASLVNIGLNFWLMPHFGYVGAAWVTAATESFVMLYDITVVVVLTRYFPDLRLVLAVLAAATPLGIMLFAPSLTSRVPALAHLPFASYIEGVVALGLYGVLLMVFGVVRPSVIGQLFGRKARPAPPRVAPAVNGYMAGASGYAVGRNGVPSFAATSSAGGAARNGARRRTQREPELAGVGARAQEMSPVNDDPDEYQIWMTDEAPTLVLGAIRLGPRSSQTGSFAAIKKPPQD